MATIAEQMAANSAAWKTATPTQQAALHQANLDLAKQTGQAYNSGSGTYSTPTAAVASKPPSAYDWSNNNTNEIPKSGGGGGTPAPIKPVLPQAQQQVTNPTATPVAAQQTATQQGSYPGQLTTAQIQAEAQARIDKQRAALMNAVNGAKTGAKNTYDYTQGLQKDNRVLEDAQFQRNNNPFSGGTDYKTAMVNRDRQIADTASSKDYNNTIAGYDAQVASFDTLAPGQQQAAIDELTRIERQYGIDLSGITGQINGQNTMQQNQNNFNNGIAQGNLTGQYNGQQTLAAQAQAYNQSPTNPNNVGQSLQNQLAQYQLDNYPAEAKAKATLLEQQVKSGALSQEAAAYNLQQLKDPNSPANQAAKLDLQMKQIDAKNYSQTAQLELQKLQKTIADIGVIHTQPQSAADIAADKVKLATANKQLEDIKNGIYPGDKTPKPVVISSKESTDNVTTIDGDLKLAGSAAKANQLIEANKDNLTDADYKALKKDVKDGKYGY